MEPLKSPWIILPFFILLPFLSPVFSLQCACNVRPREVNHMMRDLSSQQTEKSDVNSFRSIITEIINSALKDCESTGHCDINLKESTKRHIRPACMAMTKDNGQTVMSCYFSDAATASKSNFTCTEEGLYLCFTDHCNHFRDDVNPCSRSYNGNLQRGAASKASAISGWSMQSLSFTLLCVFSVAGLSIFLF